MKRRKKNTRTAPVRRTGKKAPRKAIEEKIDDIALELGRTVLAGHLKRYSTVLV